MGLISHPRKGPTDKRGLAEQVYCDTGEQGWMGGGRGSVGEVLLLHVCQHKDKSDGFF